MKQKHLVFATYELHPITAGGCGVFIWHAINELLETTDYKITILIDIPKVECEQFINEYKSNLPNHERLNIVCLSDRIPWTFLPIDAFDNIFMFKSYIFYEVLKNMSQEEQIDYIEFFDYVGIGYFSVQAKKYQGEFANTLLGIRGHCTVDLMDLEQSQVDFSKEKIEMYQIEKMALQDADVVLVQTEAWKELYANRYNISLDKIVVAEPPINNSDFPSYEPKPNKNVLFYGRVFQLKGIDEYVQAGIEYLRQNPDNKETNFYIVGYDGTTPGGQSYTSSIKAYIPEELKQRFIFTGKLNRIEFKGILDNTSVAVFPNYVESFCYSIHEIYEAGVPVICRDIPAFSSYFKNQVNCLTYEGGIQNLVDKLSVLLENKVLQKELSFPDKVLKNIEQKDIYDYLIDKYIATTKLKQTIEAEKISIICVSEETTKISLEDALPTELKLLDDLLNKCYVLYTNQEFQNSNNLMKIKFLGKDVYVQSTEGNNTLQLESNILLCHSKDCIDSEYIKDALKIVNNTDVKYILAAYNNQHGKTIYPKYPIYKNYNHMIYTHIETAFISLKEESNLKDLFDIRNNQYGQLAYLQKEGYVIPKVYKNQFNQYPIENKDLMSKIFCITHACKDNEWDPLTLINFLSKEVIQEKNNSELKQKYHEIKDKLYSSNRKEAKIILKVLMKLKDIYCKRLKFNER